MNSSFSVFRKLVLIFVRNRNGAVILDTKLFVFRAWKGRIDRFGMTIAIYDILFLRN